MKLPNSAWVCTVTVGVTGHTRFDGGPAAIAAAVASALSAVADAAREGVATGSPRLVLVSCLALGTDQLAATAGLALGYELLARCAGVPRNVPPGGRPVGAVGAGT